MNVRSLTDDLQASLDSAALTVSQGKLIVLPTDTVYGIGADAFNPAAVANLLEAKGRGRNFPPPVLIGSPELAAALAAEVTEPAQLLIDNLWPGALTIILEAQPSLAWDLGDTHGTVALRMPGDDRTLELLQRTGPLAVSSANTHGQPPATTVAEAGQMLGESVALYLDGGPSSGQTASTIVDLTVSPARILRQGDLARETIADLIEVEENPE